MPTMVMDTGSLPQDIATRHVAGQVVNAIAQRDWKLLASCVAPDIVYWRPGTSDRVDGADRYLGEWKKFFEGTSRLVYRAHTVLVQGDTAMIEATAEGAAADGTPLAYSMVSVLRVANGRLAEEREYIVPRTTG